jgi:molybdate transport system substrate-binding protein
VPSRGSRREQVPIVLRAVFLESPIERKFIADPLRAAPWKTLMRVLVRVLCAMFLLTACRSEDRTVHIAVAANFTEPAKEIARLYEEKTSRATALSFGSTGQLLTQITQEAPFEIFLAADQESPKKTVADGLGIPDSVFTYAIGKLVLFSTTLDLTNGETILRDRNFDKIAIANPTTAPYGAAAVEAMKGLGVYDQLNGKIVQGNNIAQTFQFVETSNAQLGFVALSQVVGRDAKSLWRVPEDTYAPVRQDAVLLKQGADKESARAFMTFLKSPEAGAVIRKFGYSTP